MLMNLLRTDCVTRVERTIAALAVLSGSLIKAATRYCEEADVGEGAAAAMQEWAVHQGLHVQVVLGQPTVEGVLGHRSVPRARVERVNSGRLPHGRVTAHQHPQSWPLPPAGSVEEPQFEFHRLVIQDGQAVVITSVAVE